MRTVLDFTYLIVKVKQSIPIFAAVLVRLQEVLQMQHFRADQLYEWV